MRDDGPPVPDPEPGPRSAGRADWYNKTSAASIGIEMAVAICGGALGGMWIERHWTHWAPWTSLIGLMIGIGAAGLAIARVVREHERDVATRRAAGGPGAPPGPEITPSSAGSGTPKTTPGSGSGYAAAGGQGGRSSRELSEAPAERAPADGGSPAGSQGATPRRPRAAPLPDRGPLP